MLNNTAFNGKKTALQAEKEKILQEINYYEKRIKDFPSTNSCFYYDDSSDSEDGFPAILDIGPSISELKHQDRLLRTCLQATEELTGVDVLQSEVNVLVKDPVLEGERPVTEPGSWREVTAECRIDLVPFSITFYTHQNSRQFAPTSFRGLQVLPVKSLHEAELSKSVLSSLRNPSDAIQVLRSYAIAYRSRRTTLARLADRYANNLFMEPLAEGGFVLKCANLLEMSWRLDNKLLPNESFRHRMSFELEYMDESYLKIIKQAHRQLSDPSLQTDERTQLLAKIISTCLEAQSPTQELYESMESDPESIKKLEKTTLDEDSDVESHDDEITRAQTHKRKRDEDIMAPPKSIPKKTKPKGKENMDENRRAVKRSSPIDNHNTKKAKTDAAGTSVSDMVKQKQKNVSETTANQKNSETDQKATKNTEKGDKPKNSDTDKKSSKVTDKVEGKIAGNSKNIHKTSEGNVKNTENKEPTKKVTNNDKTSKTNQVKSTEVEKKTNQPQTNLEKTEKNKTKQSSDNQKIDKKVNNKITKTVKNNEDAIKKTKVTEENKNADNVEKTNTKRNEKTTTSKAAKAKPIESEKQIPKNNEKVNIPDSQNSKTTKISEVKTKNSEKTTTSKSAKAKPIESEKQIPKNIEKVNIPNSKNSKTTKISEDKTIPMKSGNKEIKIDTNVKKSAHSDPAKVKNNANSDLAKAKKNLNSDEPKKSVNSDSAKVINTNSDEAKKSVNSEPAKAKNNANSELAKAKKNLNSDEAKKSINSDTTNSKKSVNSNKNSNNIEKPSKTLNIVTNNKNLADTEKNRVKHTETNKGIPDQKKPHPKNSIKYNINEKKFPKNHEKSKIVIKNHRNSSENRVVKKSISTVKNLKANEGSHTKIPLKKLSPAYAAVLKQNPVRISPRMMSKFKSPSDSNIQSKLFKTVTNIPRLLKKPAPKSK